MSVRKRAIRSLWDCCTCPGFNRAAEAVVAVLQRAGDSEESMRGLVTKICGEMWFLEGSSFAGGREFECCAVLSHGQVAWQACLCLQQCCCLGCAISAVRVQLGHQLTAPRMAQHLLPQLWPTSVVFCRAAPDIHRPVRWSHGQHQCQHHCRH